MARHGTAREKKNQGMKVKRKWVWSVAACSGKIEKQYKPREKTAHKTKKVMQICGCTVEIASPLAKGVVAKNSFEGGKCLRHGRAGTAAPAGTECFAEGTARRCLGEGEPLSFLGGGRRCVYLLCSPFEERPAPFECLHDGAGRFKKGTSARPLGGEKKIK